MTAPVIVRLPDGRMAIQTLGGVNAVAGNVGLGSAETYDGWNLPAPQTEPVYTEDEVMRAHAALADPKNPAYDAVRKFNTPGGRYEGLTPIQRAAMEETEAAMEVGEITDLGSFESLEAVPSDTRTRMAGSIAGDEAKEREAMRAYDAAEAAGEDPMITGLSILTGRRPQSPVPAPAPKPGGNIYD